MADGVPAAAGVTATWAGVAVTPIPAPVLPDEFQAAIKQAGLRHQASWSVSPTAGPPAGAAVAAAAAAAAPAPTMSITVPRTAGAAVGNVLLIDHGGVYTWERPQVQHAAALAESPGAVAAPASFVLSAAELLGGPTPPSPPPPPAGSPEAFGALPHLLHKVISVFAYPLISGVANAVIKDREMHHHPYELRIIGDTEAADVVADQLTRQQWESLSGAPALLLLHGIFGTSRGTFTGILDGNPAQSLPSMIPTLRTVYGNRILAFDHPTVSVGPAENAQQFLSRVPADLPFTFDVLVHSRGGLVARCIAASNPAQVKYRKVVFAGTPNNGTEIAAPALIGQLVDRMTSFLHFVPPVGPPGTVAAVLTSVLEVVKVFGQGIEGGMPGLTDMQPDSALLTTLNASPTPAPPPSTPYFEIDANYRPDGSLKWLMRGFDDVEDDAVFGGAANDVAVPSAGVGDTPPGPGFPVPETSALHYPSGVVWHCTYFEQAQTHADLRSWLVTP
ncbi:MAG TPA: hypothetical protein VK662_10570 [Acidothermaceae bacterium]|jgi:hypothetical protein|nr:hypothetical protein [Acidothermaceae bacterium]